MNKITIIVKGPAGSGKSAIAQYLRDTLCVDGFDVTYENPDTITTRSILQNAMVLTDIVDRSEIVIEEKQAPRHNPQRCVS
jgi:adenylylsulfate kinase-like enzyme